VLSLRAPSLSRLAWLRLTWLRLTAPWRLALAAGDEQPAHAHDGDNPPDAAAQQALVREFERFFREHEPRVSGYLYRMLGDAQSASDLSQETFVRAWQRFAVISRYERPGAWLLRVATNLALQQARRRAHPVGAASTLDESFEPSESDPGRRFALRDLVRETLLELAPKPRAMLVLREVYGLSAEEIAAMLAMSLEAVKVALWRARTQFRAAYLRKDGQP
jgi:RNA polymerase sigma-70 factor, ECF subfamily